MDADDIRAVYDEIAESYAEGYWEENPYQAYYEFPMTTALVPDVASNRILDAGCGSGVYTRWLAERGAEVVAVDASEEMLAQTADLVGDEVTLHQTDVTTPLDFADDGEFDGIVSGSVLDHIEDWDPCSRSSNAFSPPAASSSSRRDTPCKTTSNTTTGTTTRSTPTSQTGASRCTPIDARCRPS